MPFRRRRRRVRRRRRRVRGRRRMRRRRLMLDPEMKTKETVVSTPVSNLGFRSFLNGVPRGVEQSNRIGFQQMNVSALVKYSVNIQGTTPTLIRISLVLFKQPGGVDIGLDTVYTNTGSAFAPIGPRVLNNALAFKVLWTRTHRIDIGNQVTWRLVSKKLRLITRYNNTGNGAIGDTLTGALYLLVHSDKGQGTGTEPVITFTSRIRFVG